LPQAGWYEDPEYGGQLRWWDGTRWTADRRSMPLAASSALRQGAGAGGVAPPAIGPPPQAPAGYGQAHPAPQSGYRAEQPGYGQTQWSYPSQQGSGQSSSGWSSGPGYGPSPQGYEQVPPAYRQSPLSFPPSARASAPTRRWRPIYSIAGSAAVLVAVASFFVVGALSPSTQPTAARSPSLIPPHHVTPSTPTTLKPKTTPTTSPTKPVGQPTKPVTKPTKRVTKPTTIPTLRGPSVAMRQRAFLAELASSPARYRNYPGPAQRLVRLGDRECHLAPRVTLDDSWWDVIHLSAQRARSAIPAVQAEQLVVAAHRTLCPAEATTPALAVFTADFQNLGAAIKSIPLRSKVNVEDANFVSALSCSILDRTGEPSALSKALVADVQHHRLAMPVHDLGRASTDGIRTMCGAHLPAWTRFVRAKGALDARRSGRTATRRASRVGGHAESIRGVPGTRIRR
jgi:hypothetical protein